MSFLSNLRKDKMNAMREKDKLKGAVVTNLMSAISLAEKEAKRELTDAEALVYVQKELKKNEDTLESLPENRVENIEEAKARIAIIKSYLPSQLSEEELADEILKIVEEKELEKSPKSLGTIIPIILEKFPARTDGKQISKVASKVLK